MISGIVIWIQTTFKSLIIDIPDLFRARAVSKLNPKSLLSLLKGVSLVDIHCNTGVERRKKLKFNFPNFAPSPPPVPADRGTALKELGSILLRAHASLGGFISH